MKVVVQSRSVLSLSRRSGFTLLEMVVVMWTLGFALLIGSALLLGSVRMERATAASYHRLTLRSELADQFRADVAQAVSAPDNVDRLTASPTCLILRLAENKHVVYRWEDGRLERNELAGTGTARRRFSLGVDQTAVEFTRAGLDGRVVTMRMSQLRGPTNVERQIAIAAALGGDVR
jgi:type II secretory pathway pseudopilin PulG